MINTTLDNGKRLIELIIGVSLFLALKLLGKVKNINQLILSDQQQIKICFKLVPVSNLVNLLHQFST